MFVALWSNVLEKGRRKERKKKTQTCVISPVSQWGWSIQGITRFHIFAALKADVLLLFSKDMCSCA